MTVYPVFTYGQPLPNQPTLEHVFGVLVKVIADLQREGRSTRSAGIKPRLTQYLGYQFDEKQYRFATFRVFLRAAENAGVIQLQAATSGPDLDVALPGQRLQVSEPGPPTPVQIRPDLWSTFMNWAPGSLRAYDREQAHAVRIPEQSAEYDPQSRQLRDTVREDPDRFITIDPIPRPTQIQWARDFAARLPPGSERHALEFALSAERPLQEFTRLVRTMPCGRAWAAFRNERVVDFIKSWAREHQLEIDPIEPSRPVETAPAPQPAEADTRSKVIQAPPGPAATSPHFAVDLAALRAQVHDLVDRMTADELLALPITLGLLHRR